MQLPTPGPILSVQDAGSVGRESACNLRSCRRQGFNPGWGNPLEEEVATHSCVLAGIIPGSEAPGGLRPMGSQRDTTEHA